MLGNKIKSLREELGLKQEDLAKKMSISPSTIGMYEINKREPNNDLLLKLANFFGVSVDYLLGKSYYRNYEDFEKIDNFVLNYKKTGEEAETIAKTLNYINTHKEEKIEDVVNNAVKKFPTERQEALKTVLFHLYYRYHGKLPKIDEQIKQEFEFAYHKEMEGLTEEEIADALRFYKQIKYGNKGGNK